MTLTETDTTVGGEPAPVLVPTPNVDAYVKGLRALANFVEARAQAFEPHVSRYDGAGLSIWLYDDDETVRAQMAELAKAMAPCRKDYGSDTFRLDRNLDDDGRFYIRVASNREKVCTKRVVGTERVTVRKAVDYVELVEERDVVEWDCHPLLSGAGE